MLVQASKNSLRQALENILCVLSMNLSKGILSLLGDFSREALSVMTILEG